MTETAGGSPILQVRIKADIDEGLYGFYLLLCLSVEMVGSLVAGLYFLGYYNSSGLGSMRRAHACVAIPRVRPIVVTIDGLFLLVMRIFHQLTIHVGWICAFRVLLM